VGTASADFHESPDDLRPETRDGHRGIVSLIEELEAVDWYDQRIDAAGDDDLRAILRHNRDEEKEHASMLLEWLRRQDEVWHEHLSRYLFTDASLALVAAEEAGRDAAAPPEHPPVGDGSLGIGSLADKEML
jgi:hypothetical protein